MALGAASHPYQLGNTGTSHTVSLQQHPKSAPGWAKPSASTAGREILKKLRFAEETLACVARTSVQVLCSCCSSVTGKPGDKRRIQASWVPLGHPHHGGHHRDVCWGPAASHGWQLGCSTWFLPPSP